MTPTLPWSAGRHYDGRRAVFLPLIPILAVCLLLPAAAAQEPAPAPATAVVAAGSGDVAPATLARVRAAVDEGLVRLRPAFPGMPARRFFVHVHEARDTMPSALAAYLHPDSPAFALLGQRQVHVVWGEVRRLGAAPLGVVVHELVHELLDQYVGPHGRRIPRWFHEGLAQHLAGDTYLGAREEDLVWPIATQRLPAFGELRAEFPSDHDALRTAYAMSYSYVTWLAREYGLADLLAVARATDERTSFERALVGRLRRSTLELEDAWRHHVLHGSGASWRVVFDQCFSLLLVAALPILVLALMRRLRSEERAARTIEARAAASAAAIGQPPEPPPEPPEPAPEPPPADAEKPEDGRDERRPW